MYLSLYIYIYIYIAHSWHWYPQKIEGCSAHTTTKRKLQRPRAAESSIASQLNKKKVNWELLDCVPSQYESDQGGIRVFPQVCGQTEVACEEALHLVQALRIVWRASYSAKELRMLRRIVVYCGGTLISPFTASTDCIRHNICFAIPFTASFVLVFL